MKTNCYREKENPAEAWPGLNIFYVTGSRKSKSLRDFNHVTRLRAFLTFDDFEFHLIALSEAFIAFRGDSAVMDEDIGAVVTTDKAVALRVVKPLHSTLETFHLQSSSVRAESNPAIRPT